MIRLRGPPGAPDVHLSERARAAQSEVPLWDGDNERHEDEAECKDEHAYEPEDDDEKEKDEVPLAENSCCQSEPEGKGAAEEPEIETNNGSDIKEIWSARSTKSKPIHSKEPE